MPTDKIQAALATEIRRFRGKGKLEQRYRIRFSRVAKKATSATLERALHAMGIPDVDNWIARRAHAPVKIPAVLESLPRPSTLPRPIGKLRRLLREQDPKQTPTSTHVEATEALDLLRYDDPHQAANEARALALGPSGGLEAIVRAGMAWASALRFAGDLMHAGMVLRELDPYAWRLGRRLEAELLQRITPLMRNHSRFGEAIRAARMAQALYTDAGDRAGVAKVLVDQAACQYAGRKPDQTIAYASAALELLPKDLPRSRAAAHLLLGLASRDRNQIDLAEEIYPHCYRFDRFNLAYNRARLAIDPQEAEHHVRCALRLANGFNPFDTAFAIIDLAELLLEQGKEVQAAAEIQKAYQLLVPLRRYTAACTALVRLGGLGQARLTIEALHVASGTIRRAQMGLTVSSSR